MPVARVAVLMSSLAGRRFRLPVPSRRSILIIAGCLALGGLALGLGWFWYSAYQTDALALYVEAMARAQESQAPDAPAEMRGAAVRALEAALAAYPSSSAAPEAAYQLGNLRYAAREYAAARGAFEVALAKGAAGTLQTLARASVGYTWEAEGDFAKALQAYQVGLSGAGPDSFFFEELMMDLARVQELSGQRDAAIATYRRILKDLPSARRVDAIRVRLATLGAATR
jgi:tetratricopeptide (TPR) repeat protein